MNKRKAGLPEGYDLEIDNPVSLGDYLDDDLGSVDEEPKVVDLPLQESRPIPTQATSSAHEEYSKPIRKRLTEPPRKQVNMKPATIRKAEELLEIVQEKGPQRDAAFSEMIDAVISGAYEHKDHLDLTDVPKRGRWGSPTASAFVTALGEAFIQAVLKGRGS